MREKALAIGVLASSANRKRKVVNDGEGILDTIAIHNPLRACETLWSARAIPSVALSAERKRPTETVLHIILTLIITYFSEFSCNFKLKQERNFTVFTNLLNDYNYEVINILKNFRIKFRRFRRIKASSPTNR